MKTVLSIAGSDTIGGAGIQADLKTIAAHGLYGMTVITALTAQNTLGVQAIHEAPPEFVRQEIDSVFSDIVPDAVKIGMVSSAAIIRVIAERLRFYGVKRLVVDPVMVATSGSRLLVPEAQTALQQELLPLATVITPNLPEAMVLSGMDITSPDEMLAAAQKIGAMLPGAVLVKGGHLAQTADDLLWIDGQTQWYHAPRIPTENTHGTGCTLSSAIACGLAKGLAVPEAVRQAKEYITAALQHDPRLGHGNGPLNHVWKFKG
ncbi:MAG: bifunctional hydroxymethylpyrimidine kinase/phosphomethylpyrimidine kinase [Victivallales bacterium]|nr:bifunctional hydroxymethylpyrimidine kinase/phosphomethylpyrimidine kinase [Victivallales bacterium]